VPFTGDELQRFANDFASYSARLADGINRVITDFRERLGQISPAYDRLRLAIDEWGIVRDWNAAPDEPGLGAFEHYYTMGDAVTVARGLNEILRAADVVEMANWAQTVNVLGAIKTTQDTAVLDPVGHVLALYREQVGGQLMPTSLSYAAILDVVAAWDEGSRSVSLVLVNYSALDEVSGLIELEGARETGRMRIWQIKAPALDATNIPGKPQGVGTARPDRSYALDYPISLPPHSVTVVRVDRVRRR
jgi:alpha-N-arabinofuranosidase